MDRRSSVAVVCALAAAVGLVAAAAPRGSAEQAGSDVRRYQAGLIDAGRIHTCAVLDTGGVDCWGDDQSGALGNGGANVDSGAPLPAILPPGRRATAVSAGGTSITGFTCGVLDDGRVTCWGSNAKGQLGTGRPIAPSALPVIVAMPGGRPATAITAGTSHACALLDNGSAACWGDDFAGQIGNGGAAGDGPDGDNASPALIALSGGRRVTAISAGGSHTCAVLDNGSAACWGSDASGQIGNGGANAGTTVPVTVVLPAGRQATAITAGDIHTCAILDDGRAVCWGSDANGRLGNGGLNINSGVPITVALPAGRRAIAISAGGNHTCAVLDDGRPVCWGDDTFGQLGNGGANQATGVPGPVALPSGQRATAITAGGDHTCAMLDDGSAGCWGSDSDGQLGDGGANTNAGVPTAAQLPLGSVIGQVADLSIGVTGLPAQLVVGQSAQATVVVANGGPDAAGAVRVDVAASVVELAGAAAGQGTFAGGQWQVGSLAPGAQATLTLTLGAPAAGAGSVIAQVAVSAVRDPDSTPGDGAAGQDDLGSASTVVSATAGGVIKCDGRIATIVGTPGRDTIVGTPGADVIAAQGGNDVVRSLGGADRICLGAGSDRAMAGSGADRVFGEAGADSLVGGGGNDLLAGGDGNDAAAGGLGNDRLIGGAGRDRLSGDAGRDILAGGAGRDRVNGGSGRDTCTGEIRTSC